MACPQFCRGPTADVSGSGAWPGFDLVGLDLDRADASYHPGDISYLQALWWRATEKPDKDWTVFTHLLGPAKPDGNRVWAGGDPRPGQGSVGTTTWAPGDLILDEYQLQLPPDAPPDEYEIEIGLYNPAAGGMRLSRSIQPARIIFCSTQCACVDLFLRGGCSGSGRFDTVDCEGGPM